MEGYVWFDKDASCSARYLLPLKVQITMLASGRFFMEWVVLMVYFFYQEIIKLNSISACAAMLQ